jgi:hypothetical protein
MVRFTRMYRHYLLGRRFIVRTDHHSLIWLLNFKSPQDQLARWLEELSQYNMEIHHRPGRKHTNADALSRLPHTYEAADTAMATHLKDLPCGGCQKCTRAHESWNTFTEEVDDVAPLAKPGTWTYSPESDKEPGRPPVALYQCYPGNGRETLEKLTRAEQPYTSSQGIYCIRPEPPRNPAWTFIVAPWREDPLGRTPVWS